MHRVEVNVIAFQNPMPKMYQRLPPPIEDLNEVLLSFTLVLVDQALKIWRGPLYLYAEIK